MVTKHCAESALGMAEEPKVRSGRNGGGVGVVLWVPGVLKGLKGVSGFGLNV
jgi:hypothetical protein